MSSAAGRWAGGACGALDAVVLEGELSSRKGGSCGHCSGPHTQPSQLLSASCSIGSPIRQRELSAAACTVQGGGR